jgi:hypothetical protein
MRSGLWEPERWPELATLPTPGRILGELSAKAGQPIDGAAYDAALRPRQSSSLY